MERRVDGIEDKSLIVPCYLSTVQVDVRITAADVCVFVSKKMVIDSNYVLRTLYIHRTLPSFPSGERYTYRLLPLPLSSSSSCFDGIVIEAAKQLPQLSYLLAEVARFSISTDRDRNTPLAPVSSPFQSFELLFRTLA